MRLLSLSIMLVFCYSVNAADKIKLSCIGNSITEGYATYATYVPALQSLLGSEYILENDGVSGTTALKKSNKSYWKYGKLSQVFIFRPDLITIKLGTNDSKQENWDYFGTEFKSDYLALIDTLLTLEKKPKIFLVLPVPAFKSTYNIRNEIIDIIIPIIKNIGSEQNLTVIDANTPLKEFGTNFPDGVHPDNVAAKEIAKAIYASLASATSVKRFPYEILSCKVPRQSFDIRCTLNPFRRSANCSQFNLNGVRIVPKNSGKLPTLITVIPYNGEH